MVIRPEHDYDLVVLGGGIVGIATALDLKRRRPDAKVAILEKNLSTSKEQTSHSSGCIHAGLQYAKGSHMARLCIQGNDMVTKYCKKKGVSFMPTGKLTIARDEKQKQVLVDLYESAKENGVPHLEFLTDRNRILEVEPGCANSIAALLSPTSGTVQFGDVSDSLRKDFLALPGTCILEGFEAKALIEENKRHVIVPNTLPLFTRLTLRRRLKKTVPSADDRVTVVGCEAGQTGPLENVTSKCVFTAMGIKMDNFAPRDTLWAKFLDKKLPCAKFLKTENQLWSQLLMNNHYKGIPAEYGFWNNVITPLVGHYLEIKEEYLKQLRLDGKVDLTKHIYPTLVPGDFFSVGTHLTPTVPKESFMSRSVINLPRRSYNNDITEPGVIIGPLGGLSVEMMASPGRSQFSDPARGMSWLLAFAKGGLRQFVRDAGFRKLALTHPIICLQQMMVDEKKIYEQAAQLCPYLSEKMLRPSYTGIMAQTFNPKTGGTLPDFIVKLDPRFARTRTSVVQLLNAPSPAATSCMALGQDLSHVLDVALQRFEQKEKK